MYYIALAILSPFFEFDNGLWIIALRSNVFHTLVGLNVWREVGASTQWLMLKEIFKDLCFDFDVDGVWDPSFPKLGALIISRAWRGGGSKASPLRTVLRDWDNTKPLTCECAFHCGYPCDYLVTNRTDTHTFGSHLCRHTLKTCMYCIHLYTVILSHSSVKQKPALVMQQPLEYCSGLNTVNYLFDSTAFYFLHKIQKFI